MNTKYDMPDNYYFGGGASESFITPLAGIILFIAIVLIFGLRRKWLIVPFLAAGVLLPFNIMVVVFGVHFQALRIVLLACWLRILLRRDIQVPRMNLLDKAVLFWALSNAVFFCLLWTAMGAVNNRIGFLGTTLGTYFLVRSLIRDKADVVRVIKTVAVVMAIIAPLMLMERYTQRNVFSVVGAPLISTLRDGAARAQGPFEHPVIAGTVGAMLLPLFAGLWWQGKRHRKIVGLAVISGIGIVIASGSSTPLMTAAAGVCALLLWPFRAQMRICRWALAISLAVAQLAMKAPVWFVLAHAGSVFGGSGYHRATLMDTFAKHFGEWWLIGTRNNANWGFDMWDVDNAFVAAGVSGGLITFLAFIAVLVYAYKRIGKSRRLTGLCRGDEHLVWALGACLFANTVGYFGIVYFDQSNILWYTLLAMISATAVFNAPSGNGPVVRVETGVSEAMRIGKGIPATASFQGARYNS